MKIFKITDAFIQVALIIFFTVYIIVREVEMPDKLFLAYYIVGAYQVVSCLIHLFMRLNQNESGRWIYQRLLAGLIIFGVISTLLRSAAILWVLLLCAPFLAIFYTSFSIRETYKLFDHEK